MIRAASTRCPSAFRSLSASFVRSAPMSAGTKRAVIVRSSVVDGADVFSCTGASPEKAAPAAVRTMHAIGARYRCVMVIARCLAAGQQLSSVARIPSQV